MLLHTSETIFLAEVSKAINSFKKSMKYRRSQSWESNTHFFIHLLNFSVYKLSHFSPNIPLSLYNIFCCRSNRSFSVRLWNMYINASMWWWKNNREKFCTIFSTWKTAKSLSQKGVVFSTKSHWLLFIITLHIEQLNSDNFLLAKIVVLSFFLSNTSSAAGR